MPRAPRRLQINRQQKHILLLALFLLKYEHGTSRPAKRQVLTFIALQHLIEIRHEDLRLVASGEEAWANDIAWRREDLKKGGLLTMPKRGEWQITQNGEECLIQWCATIHYFAFHTPDWESQLNQLEVLFQEKIVITKRTVLAAQRAYAIAARLFSSDLLVVPETVKGRLRL